MFENLETKFRVFVKIRKTNFTKPIVDKILEKSKRFEIKKIKFSFQNYYVTISNIRRPYELKKAIRILGKLLRINQLREDQRQRKTIQVKKIAMKGCVLTDFSIVALERRLVASHFDAFYDKNRFQSLIIKFHPGYVYISEQGALKLFDFSSIEKTTNTLSLIENHILSLWNKD